jgi:uncharacterized iron-regulated protein
MKPLILFLVNVILVLAGNARADLRLYDLRSETLLRGEQVLETLATAGIILVGEHHTNPAHHAAQLALIRAVHEAGREIAIGMEMFRHDRQETLDRWVQGGSGEAELKSLYRQDWNFPWELYRPIFEYARDNRIPITGLNVPREITRQVARHGFESLSLEQKELLGNVTCDITPAYRDFVARAHGAHGHGGLEFESFCEAQMVWDTAMATHAVRFVTQHPGRILIILAGSGHARHPGIPTQLRRLSEIPLWVVLPETPQIFEPSTISAQEADFLLLTR